MMNRRAGTGIGLLLLGALCAAPAPVEKVTIEARDDRYIIKIDGELFTEYRFKGYDKPILYPIIGPHGIPMTRNWPMTEATEGEAKDHPHHKSLWFTHGNVNGVDFWAEGPRMGKVATVGRATVTAWPNAQRSSSGKQRLPDGTSVSGKVDRVRLLLEWRGPDGSLVCREERDTDFGVVAGNRFIDVTSRLYVSQDNTTATFGDTKEGTMAIRTRPELEIKNGAAAVNSEGVTGKDLWGKRARWVDYSGVVEGKTVGVAIFDHPANPRHPTWWHARDYGLIAANPFGIHDFEKKPPGTGDMTIPAGQSVTFRYRLVFHEGDAEAAGIARMYEAYVAAAKPSEINRQGSE
jgi:hypothetical protein